MALSMTLKTQNTANEKTIVFDDVIVWYLHPYFEKIPGHTIDLYDDADIYGTSLDFLIAQRNDALHDAKKQPAQWEVFVGAQIYPVKKDLYKTIQKNYCMTFIQQLLEMATVARKDGGHLLFEGD